MPEVGAPRLLRLLGHLLPSSRRELVFEPFCEEIWRRNVIAGRTISAKLRFWVGVVEAFLATAISSTPRYFLEHGRLTTFARVVAVTVTALVLAAGLRLIPWIVLLVTHATAS